MSPALLQLAAGQCLHEAFRGFCLGPPFYNYHGARAPEGPTLVPLWEHGSRVCALRESDGGLEFIEFSIEDPAGFERLAGNRAGVLGEPASTFSTNAIWPMKPCAAPPHGSDSVFSTGNLRSREAAEEQLGASVPIGCGFGSWSPAPTAMPPRLPDRRA
ncbi:hypothetical protein DdX_21112 [Ditylenchus destructor]|uniref:Uncharacterized protein n=1 Tax=Ditylenchus destructor TaxID=166010 RepID=A0AAD4QVZ6_9BILA|nr:hypothetical protein DdX_21112 [Ditylenchus destructor]